MTQPLTTEERRTLETSGEGRTHRQYLAAKAALARLDFLERKYAAAEQLRDEARYGSPSLGLRLAVQHYDEVTE